jgi:hypothetical protein
MKNRILLIQIIICLCFAGPTRLSAQHIPELLLRTAVLIQVDNGSIGSGVYVRDSVHAYLVTARHVIIQKITSPTKTQRDSVLLTAARIRCISYPADPSVSQKTILTIDLTAAYASGSLKYGTSSDVSAIRIGDVKLINDSLSLTTYYPFASKDRSTMIESVPTAVIEKYGDVHIGDDVFVFGYPTSIGLKQSPQFDYERPLLRKGTIAGKNIANRTLIIDCPVYYGNSGGPVIVRYADNPVTYYKLLGVVSGFIPYEEDWVNTKNGLTNISISNSGYSVVVPIEFILQLFDK